MGQKVEVSYYCDLVEATKHADPDTIETVPFMLGDGHTREVDLCGLHREQLDKTMAPIIAVSRRVSPGARVTPLRASRRGAASSDRADKERRDAIRAWAREHGYPGLGDKGRIPETAVTEYEAAHG